jgi:hypothetical protein
MDVKTNGAESRIFCASVGFELRAERVAHERQRWRATAATGLTLRPEGLGASALAAPEGKTRSLPRARFVRVRGRAGGAGVLPLY